MLQLLKKYLPRFIGGLVFGGVLFALSISNETELRHYMAQEHQEWLDSAWQGVVPRVSPIDSPTPEEKVNGVDVHVLLIDSKKPLSANPDGSTNFVAREISLNTRAAYIIPLIVVLALLIMSPVPIVSFHFPIVALLSISLTYIYGYARILTILRFQIDVLDPTQQFVGMGQATMELIGWLYALLIANTISFTFAVPFLAVTLSIVVSQQAHLWWNNRKSGHNTAS